MDPEQALSQARAAYAEGRYEVAAAHYAALDAWVSGGGFLPADWDGSKWRA